MLVIGLDGADPRLVFDRLAERLPTLSRLASEGAAGSLRSTVPPVTVPAWLSMFTGLDPGELGLYGFRNRTQPDYDRLEIATSRSSDAPRVWDRLSEIGLTSYLLGVPGTYPPWPIRGRMVASILAPGNQADYVWPRELKREVERVADGYLLDAEGFRSEDKHRLLERIQLMTRKRFRVARAWAGEGDWDLMVVVEMGPDRMHHAFWRHFDPGHRLHQPNHELADAIGAYYARLDDEIAALLNAAGPQASVLVVSDHGAQAMQGGFRINEWLMHQGDLVLSSKPTAPGPLDPRAVDWPRTRAWATGGYCGRIAVNLNGREPQGAVRPEDFDRYLGDLAARLERTVDEDGKPLNTRVLRPERVYRRVRGLAPDLMVYFGDLAWRAIGQVGCDGIHARENDTGPDDANHADEGIFIFRPADGLSNGLPTARCITEIAPLILAFFGVQPADAQARRWVEVASGSRAGERIRRWRCQE